MEKRQNLHMRYLIALLIVAAPLAAQSSKRLYIEERVIEHAGTNVHCDDAGNCYGHSATHERNVSLEATRDFVSSCPAVAVTDNRDSADYVLRITPGASTVFAKNGDVAYVSPAKFKLGNVVKDVCKFVGGAQ